MYLFVLLFNNRQDQTIFLCDTIPGMTSAPLAPLGDTIPPMPSASHEQGVAGSDNSYKHLFPNYSPLQSTSDDRNKVQMKCIKGEYERTCRQPTTSYSRKSSSSSSTTTSKMASSSTGGGGVPGRALRTPYTTVNDRIRCRIRQ
jgi:hypothetical protein